MKSRPAGFALGLALAIASAPAPQAVAESVGPQLLVSARGGLLSPDSNTRPELDAGPIGAGSIGVLLHRRWALEGTYGVASAKQVAGPDTRLNHVGLDLGAWFLPDSRVNPYVTGGWAQIEYDSDGAETQTLNGWEIGGGVCVRLAHRMALRLDARDLLTDQDVDSKWLHNPIVTAGVQFVFGGKLPDEDGDGVPDRDDQCANTPPGAVVDERGCPLDADGDGVADELDTCPDTPKGAAVDANGCPQDSDGDGVFDGLDACAETPAGTPVDARGCPVEAPKPNE